VHRAAGPTVLSVAVSCVCSSVEIHFELFVQRIAPNRLDGSVRPVGFVILTATGGISQIDPIGGFVTGAGKPVLVHKGLQIIDGMAI
jgi:hypothetical protein